MKNNLIRKKNLIILLVSLIFTLSCNEEDSPLASYVDSTVLQKISIQQNSYNPKITWVGGYATVLGVNSGSEAIIDESIIWLVYSDGDNVTYPATFGTLKSNEDNLAENYGGATENSLEEDAVYTFWIAKQEAWSILSNNVGNIIKIDSLLDDTTSDVVNDTLFISQINYSSLTYSLDVFVNVDTTSIQNRGRLGTIYIEQTDISNNLIITWEFADEVVTDLNIASIGICEGQQFDINKQLWDMYSIEEVGGENVYGSQNVISQPISLGENIDGTRVFYDFPEEGLERNKNYYLWIATNEWDGESRGRTANGYATITFTTW